MLVRLTTRMDFVMKQWFISDLHLGHVNVLRFRSQFQTIDQHDKHIVNSILSTVKPKDTLWILGDVILHAYSMHYLRQISDNVGHLKIVLGNHDGERKAAPTLNDLSCVARLYTYTPVGKDDNFLLSHVPVDPCNLIYQQKWNIHGHCHNGYEPTNQHFNVTCEKLDYKPISLKQIENLTSTRELL